MKTINKWGVCYWCGTTDGPFEVDHVFPASLYEDNDIRNLVCSCKSCNCAKGNKPVEYLTLDSEAKFRGGLRVSDKVERYYYEVSLPRYKKITPRGYRAFLKKPEFVSKPTCEFYKELRREQEQMRSGWDRGIYS